MVLMGESVLLERHRSHDLGDVIISSLHGDL